LQRVVQEIQSEIEIIASSEALYEEANFNDRVEAIDVIEFDIIERIEGLLLTEDQAQELVALKQYAEMVKNQLEETNKNLFQKLRASIISGQCTGAELRRQLAEYAGCNSTERCQDDVGYDSLDAFLSGLLLIEGIPGETRERQPEMVFYQPTPARIVLELIERVSLKKEDVFYDVGSGLGQVSMLVNLLSGVRAKGVEFELAYCDYARRCAKELNLSWVEFINADAREVDYSDGTVFFMYTPFEGKLLQEVLEKLKGESRKRKIKVCTYGPCTLQVSRQSWLKRVDQNGNSIHKLAVFESI
jgi:SAM-dependent methyltransferase